MAQRIYGLVSDGCDGSASIYWFRDGDLASRLVQSHESFNLNDCGVSEVLTFPDDLDLEACGFRFNDADYEDFVGDDDEDGDC